MMARISTQQRVSTSARQLHGRQLPYAISRPIGGEGVAHKTCQWLEGEAKERNFCGEPTIGVTSWCMAHHKRVFIRMPK